MTGDEVRGEPQVDAPEGATETGGRRGFLKATLAAAGAAAAVAVTTSTATANAALAGGPTSYNVAFYDLHPNIDQLQLVISQILNHTGCPACGLLGIELKLGLGTEVPIQGIGGVIALAQPFG
jgi:hypothetical protein